jgi:transposase-like protein
MPAPHKLTVPQLTEIRQMIADKVSHADIARKFGVHDSLISLIKRGKIYKSSLPAAVPAGSAPHGNQFTGGKWASKKDQVLSMRAQHVTAKEIAEKLEMPISAVNYYVYGRGPKNSSEKGEMNGNHFDTRFLVGYGCAQLDRTLDSVAQRLGISPNLLRQGFSRFLGNTALR